MSVLFFILNYEIISTVFITADAGETFLWSYGVFCFYLITYCLMGLTTFLDLALTRWIQFNIYSRVSREKDKETVRLSM
jgi:hypothetical protein